MNYPLPCGREAIEQVLGEMLAGVKSGDTLEGTVSFNVIVPEMGFPAEVVAEYPFEMVARYRVGNLQGQGGLRTVGSIERMDWSTYQGKAPDGTHEIQTGEWGGVAP
jgi:hypothetical protein